jgi:hypothetical protein
LALNLDNENQRHRVLTDGPVGRWCVLSGTHTALFDGQINFDVSGVGQLVSSNLMDGERRTSFIWRIVTFGVIECQPQHDAPLLDDNGQPEIDDWHRIRFTVERVASDTEQHWALREINHDGFWELQMPLIPMD